MNTIIIVGAVLIGTLILAFGGVFLARRGGEQRGKLATEIEQARAETAAVKAVTRELARPVTRDDVIRDLDRGEF